MLDSSINQWFLITILILFVSYVVISALFHQSDAQKEKRKVASMRLEFKEVEIMIQKLQLQLQRASGNIDLLTQELNNLKNELKTQKQLNAQYRIERDQYKNRIKDLEQKIEALL